ncbi:hypothetical protein BX589_101241 [Paraburkholderia fungorum]|uniref:crAss001_48 related protein n=1 Tax=Paraburkholderia fungorum TaxID=134537 RepID=UPI000D4BBECB|nr:hypothetical protein [Paraburkholderia fungorum]PRZ56591.1 hypothetical protein BX589_101241 [Paraburkholderia fungorum]
MSTAYAPHVQRVIDEKAELDVKRRKLCEFIDANPAFVQLSDYDRELLVTQYRVMTEYSSILRERIRAF